MRGKLVCLVAVVALSATIVVADALEDKIAQDRTGGGVYSTGIVDRDGGDDCGSAPLITTAVYNDSGDTTGYTNTWTPTVSTYTQDGEDQAYQIVITTPGTIDVSMTSTYDGSTYLLAAADCGNPTPTALAGADDAFAGGTETFNYSAAAGTYYVVVDGWNPGVAGPFSLTVTSNVPVELTKLSVE